MRFKKIYIEITNQCNLNCSFCIQNKRLPKFLSIDEYTYILDQIKPFTKYIYLHVLGEPLLHPLLKQFLQIADEKGFYVNLTTNGTLLYKNLDCLLSNSSLRQINISLHSFPDIPDYLDNVCFAADQISKKGVYISYRLWTFDGELNPSMKNTIDYLENRYHKRINQFKNSIQLAEHCFLSFDKTFKWPSIQDEFINNTGTCHGLRNMCAILSDGSVVPCCLDSNGEAKLGNIFDEPFDEIMNRNQDLLNNFQNHKMTLELCQKCTYRLRFDSK